MAARQQLLRNCWKYFGISYISPNGDVILFQNHRAANGRPYKKTGSFPDQRTATNSLRGRRGHAPALHGLILSIRAFSIDDLGNIG